MKENMKSLEKECKSLEVDWMTEHILTEKEAKEWLKYEYMRQKKGAEISELYLDNILKGHKGFITVLEKKGYISKIAESKYCLLPLFWEKVNEIQTTYQWEEEIVSIDCAMYNYGGYDKWDWENRNVRCLVLYDLTECTDVLGNDSNPYAYRDVNEYAWFNMGLDDGSSGAYEMAVIPPSVKYISPCTFGRASSDVGRDEFLGENVWKYLSIPDFKIMGTPGSAAEEYAQKEGFEFVPITPYFKTYYPHCEADFIEKQEELSKLVINDECTYFGDHEDIKVVADVHVEYWEQDGKEYGSCSIVKIDYHTGEILERKSSVSEVKVPCIPGCRSFRAFPLVKKTFDLLEDKSGIFIFDANGYLHPRHMGLASYAGVALGITTIGVAKTYYKINDIECEMPENTVGAYTDIVIENEVYGRALRTQKDVNPVFVSVGHMLDLDFATEIVSRLITILK